MHKIADKLTQVHQRIEAAARACQRHPNTVRLIAVSKHQSADSVRAAHAWGQRDFGENYLQEALDKMRALADLDLCWHFIGPIQSNKTRAIAEHFAWVHSLDRLKIAERLSAQRPQFLPALQVCLQVNIDHEASKAGLAPTELAAVASAIASLPGLQLRGLMCIPRRAGSDALGRMAALLDSLRAQGFDQLDTLSMGMSADLETAIACGATMVRVGTDIFGERRL